MTLTLPYVEARWGYKSRQKALRLIVVHSMEAAQGSRTAESCSNYFHNGCPYKKSDGTTGYRQASAHVCFDMDSGVETYKPSYTAFGAAGANADGYHIEHAGYARQTRADWTDADDTKMLARSAEWAAQVAKQTGIPAVWLSVADVRAGKKGFADHATISAAYPAVSTGHTDPGVNFPRDTYIGLVKHFLGATQVPAATVKPTTHVHSHTMPLVTSPTNAKIHKVNTYTYNGTFVKDLQGHLNVIFKGVRGMTPLVADGACGDKTVQRIILAQKKFRLTADGICGTEQTWPKVHGASGGKRINEKGQAF